MRRWRPSDSPALVAQRRWRRRVLRDFAPVRRGLARCPARSRRAAPPQRPCSAALGADAHGRTGGPRRWPIAPAVGLASGARAGGRRRTRQSTSTGTRGRVGASPPFPRTNSRYELLRTHFIDYGYRIIVIGHLPCRSRAIRGWLEGRRWGACCCREAGEYRIPRPVHRDGGPPPGRGQGPCAAPCVVFRAAEIKARARGAMACEHVRAG